MSLLDEYKKMEDPFYATLWLEEFIKQGGKIMCKDWRALHPKEISKLAIQVHDIMLAEDLKKNNLLN